MSPSNRRKPTTTAAHVMPKPPIKAPPALAAAKNSHEVNRALFTLPSSVWMAIDVQRRNTGLSAAQWITSLVLKAAK